jgi:hypothetical protein
MEREPIKVRRRIHGGENRRAKDLNCCDRNKIQSIHVCMSVTPAILLAGGRPPDPLGSGPTSATEGEVT